jgi:hypothetical protein
MDKLKIATAAFAILAGASMMAGTASAMPINGQLSATAPTTTEAQQVRWVCGPYRCWHQPGGYYYGGPPRFYGGGYWHRGWGWHGGWHRGWGWHGGGGWHRHWR